MDRVWLISLVTLKEGIRNRALQGILIIALFSCIAYLTIIPMFAFDTGKVAVDLGFASMTLAGLAIVIFLGIGLLTQDIHQRSVCMILSRPVSRTQYVLGKFLGLSGIVLVGVLIIALIGILSGWAGIKYIPDMTLPRNFTWHILGIGILFNFLSLLIIMALAFLFTVLTTNAYLSMLFTFGVYIIGQSLETIVKVITVGDFVRVGTLYAQILKALTWILPNLRAFDLKLHISYGLPLSLPYTLWTAAYGLFYIGMVIFLTSMVFRYQEIK
jgi:ABC-type transport system involved in multi-copper enzyme maturation permease subunit